MNSRMLVYVKYDMSTEFHNQLQEKSEILHK